MEFEPVICFEIHAELKTKSKLFCRCAVTSDSAPNTHICPVCTAQPGTLPVLNRKAVEFAIMAGLAFNCKINKKAVFARKNYFYPDLPKGYQISQYEYPLCEGGYVEITGDDGLPYKVGIKRIHLEEDAGKLVHEKDFSLVDFNRAGVPLIEIVSDHTRNPIRSLTEAREYLETVRQTLQYMGVSDCVIEKGQFRCDVNVSIRKKGENRFNERVEIKNMASFKFILDAIQYEIKRQSELLKAGKKIVQETRLFDERKKITIPMRTKEDAPDYRYFPEPDLVELNISEEFIEQIKKKMPELPTEKVKRFIDIYGIQRGDVLLLTRQRQVADYFEECAKYTKDYKRLSLWIINELFRLLKESALSIEQCPVSAKDFAMLVDIISKGEITEQAAKSVLDEMFRTKKSPQEIIKEKGIKVIQEKDLLLEMVDEVIKSNSHIVEKIRSGKTEAINFLIGQVMKKTKGQADARLVKELILDKIRR